MKRRRMAIVSSYLPGETYGLLGPQMAATIIQETTAYDCIVVAVTRGDDKQLLKKTLEEYFGGERPIIGFSALSGRNDLFTMAKELTEEGAMTILAGPQAAVDFLGEVDWPKHSHRFPGLSSHFSFALHGPAEQIIPFLQAPVGTAWRETAGILGVGEGGRILQNPRQEWDKISLGNVRWNNLFRLGASRLEPLLVTTGQVLQHIGCPHALRGRRAEVDYPTFLPGGNGKKVRLLLKGCSFCDVAVDKGFHGSLDLETVITQIRGLPERGDGRKIPFELINENALPGLPSLLEEVRRRGLVLSQMNLTLRADWFILGESLLREALRLAKEMGVHVLLGSMGFESFDDRILSNLNKGLDVDTNLRAIQLMRRMKEEFPQEWGYRRDEGANHGFIYPTPWDTPQSESHNIEIISLYGLERDILPDHSIPLIIHHASALGDWIREVEREEGIQFKRDHSVIAWWQVGDRIVL